MQNITPLNIDPNNVDVVLSQCGIVKEEVARVVADTIARTQWTYFTGGLIAGAVSLWFLLYILKKSKKESEK